MGVSDVNPGETEEREMLGKYREEVMRLYG